MQAATSAGNAETVVNQVSGLMAKRSTRLEALNNTFQKSGISPETVMQNDRLIREVKKHADAVPDYRHPSYCPASAGGTSS